MIPVGAGGGFGNNVAAEIRALRQQMEELKSQIAWQQRDNEYRLDTLSMKRSWQTDNEGNIDMFVPKTIDLYIPPETKQVDRVLLRLRLLPFEGSGAVGDATEYPGTHETGVAIWSASQDYTGFETEPGGDHNHGGEVSDSGDHTHVFYLRDHTHVVEVPPHDHEMKAQMWTGALAQKVTIEINGTDVTSELGGPFSSDQASLDITQYIQTGRWNEITFGTKAGPGRVRASLFVEIYLP